MHIMLRKYCCDHANISVVLNFKKKVLLKFCFQDPPFEFVVLSRDQVSSNGAKSVQVLFISINKMLLLCCQHTISHILQFSQIKEFFQRLFRVQRLHNLYKRVAHGC